MQNTLIHGTFNVNSNICVEDANSSLVRCDVDKQLGTVNVQVSLSMGARVGIPTNHTSSYSASRPRAGAATTSFIVDRRAVLLSGNGSSSRDGGECVHGRVLMMRPYRAGRFLACCSCLGTLLVYKMSACAKEAFDRQYNRAPGQRLCVMSDELPE